MKEKGKSGVFTLLFAFATGLIVLVPIIGKKKPKVEEVKTTEVIAKDTMNEFNKFEEIYTHESRK
jgi:hypothetical protein